jgi:predicted acetyltransferase
MAVEIAPTTDADYAESFGPLAVAFAFAADEPWVEKKRRLLPPERLLAAREDGQTVGCAAAYPLALTVPGGGELRTAGVTMVAVLPTHTRRGILRGLMARQLAECRERNDVLAVLWASEGSIYGRFGYGLATLSCDIDLLRDRAAWAQPGEREGEVRLLSAEEARELLPAVYDAVRPATPGFYRRTEEWWSQRSLSEPEFVPAADSPLQWAGLALDGRPAAYAIYRLEHGWDGGAPAGFLHAIEVLGVSPRATRAIWSYLFSVDLVGRVKARRLPPDHPLLLSLAEPARLRMRVGDGIWLRLVDVERALAARERREGEPVVLELADELCPWNAGRWRVAADGVDRVEADPDVRAGAAELACVYLGAFTFTQLAAAGRVEELRPGGVGRADRIFRTDRMPWCPEVF